MGGKKKHIEMFSSFTEPFSYYSKKELHVFIKQNKKVLTKCSY